MSQLLKISCWVVLQLRINKKERRTDWLDLRVVAGFAYLTGFINDY